MEFFDKLGKKATEAYKLTADKTGKIAKEAKLKLKIGELKSQINDIYKEIGKKVYEKHIREEDIDIQKELEEQCTKIDVLSDEIEGMLQECLTLRDKKQCTNCNYEIEKESKFCPKCGAKQAQEPAKEVEVLEVLENADVKPEKEQETQDVKERLEEKIENSDEAKTENIVKTENSDESKIENIDKMENCEVNENLEKTVQIESALETADKVENSSDNPVENLIESTEDELEDKED